MASNTGKTSVDGFLAGEGASRSMPVGPLWLQFYDLHRQASLDLYRYRISRSDSRARGQPAVERERATRP